VGVSIFLSFIFVIFFLSGIMFLNGIDKTLTSFFIESCEFIEGFAGEYGGALLIYVVEVEITSCLFDRCKVGNIDAARGGAIRTTGSLFVSFCTFSGCTSHAYGGGAIAFDASSSNVLSIENTSFLFCESYGLITYDGTNESDPRVGGAIRLVNTGIFCRNCSFLNCITTRDGGAIGLCSNTNIEGTIELERCIFVSNVAGDRGGAIDARRMTLKCTNCSFLHNLAKRFGSAVAANITYSVEYIGCVFVRNIITMCDALGGSTALHISQDEECKITLSLLTFFENVASGECGSRGLIFS
jgi:hypothetical protein